MTRAGTRSTRRRNFKPRARRRIKSPKVVELPKSSGVRRCPLPAKKNQTTFPNCRSVGASGLGPLQPRGRRIQLPPRQRAGGVRHPQIEAVQIRVEAVSGPIIPLTTEQEALSIHLLRPLQHDHGVVTSGPRPQNALSPSVVLHDSGVRPPALRLVAVGLGLQLHRWGRLLGCLPLGFLPGFLRLGCLLFRLAREPLPLHSRGLSLSLGLQAVPGGDFNCFRVPERPEVRSDSSSLVGNELEYSCRGLGIVRVLVRVPHGHQLLHALLLRFPGLVVIGPEPKQLTNLSLKLVQIAVIWEPHEIGDLH
mmetsp:Transcript_99050/g.264766  ORF Transcript_99050/g.264766 Transcript_99050/m.264766 type:complete len:307 (-) Transcript_99050:122-1042(-)